MSSNRRGGKKKKEGAKKAPKGREDSKGGQQNPRKEKEKVSAGDGRKRRTKTTTKGQKVDLTQARLNLIIRSKFQNTARKEPTPLESRICQHLVDLEASSKDLKPHLRDLGIVSARKIKVAPSKSATVIFVPFRQHKKWKKLQDRLVRELEKKFQNEDVLFIAHRRIMYKKDIDPEINAPRPRTQTVTAVHEATLDDVVFPTKIVAKRTRFRVGGKRMLKVYLDPKDSKDIESRIPTFEKVYYKLTGKNIRILFPRYVI